MYAQASDFIDRIGLSEAIELTDREQLGEVDELVLNVALADASSQIDGYLNGRYRLPLMTVPQNLVRICCEMARFHLCSKSLVLMTEEVEKRYKLCLKELEQIARGVVSLAVDEETEALSASGENSVQFFNGGNRIFGRDRK